MREKKGESLKKLFHSGSSMLSFYYSNLGQEWEKEWEGKKVGREGKKGQGEGVNMNNRKCETGHLKIWACLGSAGVRGDGRWMRLRGKEHEDEERKVRFKVVKNQERNRKHKIRNTRRISNS